MAWEFVVMLRKLFITLAGSLPRDPYIQIMSALVILVGSLTLQALVQPYASRMLNLLDVGSLFILLVTQVLSIMYLYLDTMDEGAIPYGMSKKGVEMSMTIALFLLNASVIWCVVFHGAAAACMLAYTLASFSHSLSADRDYIYIPTHHTASPPARPGPFEKQTYRASTVRIDPSSHHFYVTLRANRANRAHNLTRRSPVHIVDHHLCSTLFIAFVLRMGYEKAPAVIAKVKQMRSGGDGGVESAMEVEIAKIRRHSGSNAAAAEIASRRLSATFDEIAALALEVAELKEQNAMLCDGDGSAVRGTLNPMRKSRLRAGTSKRSSSESVEHDDLPSGCTAVPVLSTSASAGDDVLPDDGATEKSPRRRSRRTSSTVDESATRTRRSERTAARAKTTLQIRVGSEVEVLHSTLAPLFSPSSLETPAAAGDRLARSQARRRSSRGSSNAASADVDLGDANLGSAQRRGSRRASRIGARRSSLGGARGDSATNTEAAAAKVTPSERKPRRASRSGSRRSGSLATGIDEGADDFAAATPADESAAGQPRLARRSAAVSQMRTRRASDTDAAASGGAQSARRTRRASRSVLERRRSSLGGGGGRAGADAKADASSAR